MKHTQISRREFLKNIGMTGAGVLLAASPWLSAFSEAVNTSNEKCRLGVIGPGSRGRFLMSFLVQNPKVDIVALCDIYQPSIDEALKLAPKAKVYGDYRELLENNNIDAILVATPLSSHCKIVMDAFDAGKHVFCEKTIGFTMEECFRMYNKHRSTGKIFFTGQQRLFDPRYIKAMEMIHAGTFGEINAIRTFWYRNGDWRRPVPSANLERQINWRLYKEYSKGKYYFESIPPAPGFLQMINDWENKLFDTLPFAGTSWAPETANENKGELILGERPKSDGTSLLLEAFVEAVITRKQPARIAEEGYYASMLCLLGHQALQEEKTLYFPDEYKINYLNHQSKTSEAV